MVGRALVVGGGAAGLQAAWGLVNAGAGVVMVEKAPVLGGNLSHNKYLFPLREEAFKVLRERFSELSKSPNFQLRLDTELGALSPKEGGFEAKLIHHPTFVDPARCDLCGDCVKASKGNPEKMCFYKPPDYRGCGLVNRGFDTPQALQKTYELASES